MGLIIELVKSGVEEGLIKAKDGEKEIQNIRKSHSENLFLAYKFFASRTSQKINDAQKHGINFLSPIEI
ncbi:hypothetical protein [Coxiella-like endosymbiont]|uniref:hypothetical protein n=1 Tax=Coxiella-like endosymbiont TaxID=1592897 RepID=UPI00272986D6|nr:hypothetical protein [Coxiella-like endosymbiont]